MTLSLKAFLLSISGSLFLMAFPVVLMCAALIIVKAVNSVATLINFLMNKK